MYGEHAPSEQIFVVSGIYLDDRSARRSVQLLSIHNVNLHYFDFRLLVADVRTTSQFVALCEGAFSIIRCPASLKPAPEMSAFFL